MEERKLEFGQAQMSALKMIGADGLYTNLALLSFTSMMISVCLATVITDLSFLRDLPERTLRFGTIIPAVS